MAGIGPGPFAGMMLADHGAEIIRIERPGTPLDPWDPLLRSRTRLALDLKNPDDVTRLRALLRTADGLIEGFRPGVMERLGLGPDVLLTDNPKLVFGRMTGWGQDGPLAPLAGHDINYISISGVLGMLGRAGEQPNPPINLVGDFGGGGMLLAFGMVSALLAVKGGADGQVVDCAMTEGAALLSSMMWGFRGNGSWREERGVNLLDTGAPYYDTYETADGDYVAIGSIEPQFYAILRDRLELAEDADLDVQDDPALWPAQKLKIATAVRRFTKGELCRRLDGTDACFTPILTMTEALSHPHNVARQTFVQVNGVDQPAPAPRYSGTPCAAPHAGVRPDVPAWFVEQGLA
jgi:alpha-methylacyl-CoA racemase